MLIHQTSRVKQDLEFDSNASAMPRRLAIVFLPFLRLGKSELFSWFEA